MQIILQTLLYHDVGRNRYVQFSQKNGYYVVSYPNL